MAQWQSGTVQQHIRWNEQLHSLRINTAPIAFIAGQYTRLGLEIDGTLVARPYSFVNAPGDPIVEFYFNTVADGPLSNRMATLEAGDSIEVSGAATGFMVLDEVLPGRDLWLLATGTAIGPFLSILAAGDVWQRFERVVLVYAVRFAADLNYSQLLDQFVEQHSQQFDWIAVVSRESHVGAMAGRVPVLIDNGALERHFGIDLSSTCSQLMVCGNPAMVKDALVVLKARGLNKNLRRIPGQVTVERYW